jgi:hypothetical protein
MFSWTLAHLKDLASIIQSLVTAFALVIGGIWAYRRYVLEENRFAHVETSAEINFVGLHGEYWIAELKAVLNNKGKVQHKIKNFGFDLNALFSGENVNLAPKWGGQVNFPHEIAKGSLLPKSFRYFVIGPGVTAKYSFVTRVPKHASHVILHCWFEYSDRRGYSHTMETTARVPTEDA